MLSKIKRYRSKIITVIALLIITIGCIKTSSNKEVASYCLITEQLCWEMDWPTEYVGKYSIYIDGYTNLPVTVDTLEEAEAYDAQAKAILAAQGLDEYGNPIDSSSSDSLASSNTTSDETTSTDEVGTETSTEAEVEITLDETFTGSYVVIADETVYSDYENPEEIDTLSVGTYFDVTAKTSNGYYQFTYNDEVVYILGEGNSNVVTKEEYDAAWEETNRVESTCTEAGYIEYTNSLSGLAKTEELELAEHVKGDEEYSKKPTLFSKGVAVYKCVNCGEVIKEREVDALVPAWLWGVAAVVVAGCIGAGVFLKKRKNKSKSITIDGNAD